MFQSLADKWAALKKKSGTSEQEKNASDVAETELDENLDDMPTQEDFQQTADDFAPHPIENKFQSDEEVVPLENANHPQVPTPMASSKKNVPSLEEKDAPEENLPRPKHSWVKIFVVLFLFLLIGGSGAGYYYISNIDWNQHKDKIAAEFSQLTGKRIVFDGPVHLTLLPAPSLQAEDIKIFAPGEETDEPLAKIKSLVANLTLNSLLKGDFDVKMMSLQEADIRLELLENNTLNWDTPLSDAQRANLENVQITLDSVLFKNATIHWIDDIRKHNFTINNINAEVIAQSIFGPYRIEGTYIKNENPEGFAFSIGRINSGLSTSVNAVINQPSTETFVRFDGSILPQNNAVNGNLIFESKKLMNFINSNSDKFKLKPVYDYPLAVILELKSNKQKIEITNFAVKYGDSAGAGNVLIPLADGEYKTQKKKDPIRPRIEIGFNFAFLDMAPVSELLKEFWNKYKDGTATYNPQANFDLLVDIKAVSSSYNQQNIKDFKLSFDFLNNKITILDLSAVLPGDTSLALTGSIYSNLNHLTFDIKPSLKTDEFRQTLNWLGFSPKIDTDILLRRVDFKGVVAGDFNKVSLNSLDLTLDNSMVSGVIGIVNDEKFNLYTELNFSLLNIDDYFPEFAAQNPNLSWAENVDALFKKMIINPDIYVELRLKSDMLLYRSLPYFGVTLNGNIKDGVLQIEDMQVADVAAAKLNLKGKVKGFGQKAEVENLKFDLETNNFSEFVSKLKLPLPNIDAKKFTNLNMQGIVTGFADKVATKTIAKLDNINIDYSGLIELNDGNTDLNGTLELKSPDFVKMVNDFDFNYAPKAFVLGLFNMKSKVSGNLQKFDASDLQFNIGSNTFQGNLSYDATAERPNIVTDLTVNRLELDKFFYNNAKIKTNEKASFRAQNSGKVNFLEKPMLDAEKFNYDFLTSFDINAKMNVARMSYRGFNFDYCKFDFISKDNVAKLSNFEADFSGGKIKSDFELSMLAENPMLSGNLTLENMVIPEKNFSGAKYGIKSGMLNLFIQYVAPAMSFADMFEKLKADGNFQIKDAVLKGWNIKDIHDDLIARKRSQGLNSFVNNKLISGEERFADVNGKFSFDNGRFILSDSLWSGDGFTANLNANSSLKTWEGEAVFDVDFAEPDYLPNFKVIYSGSLTEPELNANVDDLAFMYNQRQKEVEAKEAAELAAKKEKIRKELDNSLLKTKAMESELANVVRPDLNLKKQKAYLEDAQKVYNNLGQRLDTLESELAEILLFAQNPEITEDMIKDVNVRNDRNQKYIDDLKKEIQRAYLENLTYSAEQNLKQMAQQNDEAEKYAQKYQNEKNSLEKRISSMVTSYSLDGDENFVRLKNSFQGKILAVNKIVEKVKTDFEKLDVKNEFAFDKFLREVTTLEQDVATYLSDIKETYTQLFDYANERVKIAEEAYLKQKREEEIKKKLEENTGSISVKGTGVSKTVVRDLKDIEEAEEAVDSNQAKVLDFDNKKTSSQSKSVVRKSSDVVQNPFESGSSIVKRADGKISKATGVIIRK